MNTTLELFAAHCQPFDANATRPVVRTRAHAALLHFDTLPRRLHRRRMPAPDRTP
ncbi:hypothetical protein LFL97_26425 [Burkholderia sp. JSH-S8]|nr:hypothetical protein LFL97_26425 [Burkholderia sp. JSH-S8]